jgi:GMP synthase (glutamine-hydrolysing)
LKILVINNYKEPEKAKQALHNIALCTDQEPEMLDHNTAHLTDIVPQKDPDIVILTGSNFMLSKPDTRLVFQPEMDLVRELDRPFLGICFGHQLIGAAYGSEVVDLGHNIREYKEIKLLGSDPIFEGLPSSIRVSESHRQALARVPEGFRHLAESATSQVEAIAHQKRPLYGLQFHPERSDEKHPHGRIILQNFLKLAANF